MLSNHNWDYIFSLDTGAAFNTFLRDLQWCFDVACPIKYVHHKNHKVKDNSWLTEEIILEGCTLRRLYNNLKVTSNRIEFDAYKYRLRQHRLNIKKAKQYFYNNKINNAENKSKETWNIVNQRLGKKVGTRKLISLKIDNEIISDSNKICNKFADHFVSVAPKNIENYFGFNLSLPYTSSTISDASMFFMRLQNLN